MTVILIGTTLCHYVQQDSCMDKHSRTQTKVHMFYRGFILTQRRRILCYATYKEPDDENVQNSGKTSTGVLARGVSNEEITGKQIGSRRNANVT